MPASCMLTTLSQLACNCAVHCQLLRMKQLASILLILQIYDIQLRVIFGNQGPASDTSAATKDHCIYCQGLLIMIPKDRRNIKVLKAPEKLFLQIILRVVPCLCREEIAEDRYASVERKRMLDRVSACGDA